MLLLIYIINTLLFEYNDVCNDFILFTSIEKKNTKVNAF